MKNSVITIFVLCSAGLAGWIVSNQPTTYPFEANLQRRFSDPASVEIRDVVKDRVLPKFCGEVNARNKLGGYVGFQRFIAIPAGAGYRITLSDDVGGHFPVWCS